MREGLRLGAFQAKIDIWVMLPKQQYFALAGCEAAPKSGGISEGIKRNMLNNNCYITASWA